jgi:hypothetical protein
MAKKADHNAGKFAEPRSWAAKWCGHSLAAGQEPDPAPEASGNGRKFAEPRGWAAKWCSGGLGFPRPKSGRETGVD